MGGIVSRTLPAAQFNLLHELAHIGRHMDGKRDEVFIDDLSLRYVGRLEQLGHRVTLDAGTTVA